MDTNSCRAALAEIAADYATMSARREQLEALDYQGNATAQQRQELMDLNLNIDSAFGGGATLSATAEQTWRQLRATTPYNNLTDEEKKKTFADAMLTVGGLGASMAAGAAKVKAAGKKGGVAAVDEAAAGPVNFMGNGDQFFKNASKRLDVDAGGTFDVVAHGSTQKIEVMTSNGTVLVDQRVAAKLLENTPGYNGQPIRLLSCDTGACDAGFAQNLANKMGVSVEAPTNLVWAYGNGKMVVAPRSSLNPSSPLFNEPDLANQGTFKTFVPGKAK